MRQARSLAEAKPARRRALTEARDHLRRAVASPGRAEIKLRALERLVELHDPDHLDPREMESALGEFDRPTRAASTHDCLRLTGH
jgi:hypothetical protein